MKRNLKKMIGSITKSRTNRMLKGFGAASLALGIAAGMAALPNNADATVFQGTFTVNAHTIGDGLLINTSALGGGSFTTIDIIEGGSDTFGLFEIWTDEGTVNSDDTVAKPISVQFSFTAPPPPFDGTVEGETDGINTFFGLIQYGKVTWDGPVTLNYGGGSDGKLKISLSEEEFNLLPLFSGQKWGATVRATFANDADPSEVPEPASLALLGVGLLGVGYATRRRQQAV